MQAMKKSAGGMPEPPVPGQAFLVGCPRSGTTLLQTLLGSHSKIHSFPETHFFRNLLRAEDGRRSGPVAMRRKRLTRGFQNWRRKTAVSLGWVSGRRGNKAWRSMPELTEEPPPDLRGLAAYSLYAHISRFGALLDRQCLMAGKQLWLEKTPDHLFYIAHIQRYFPTARFIHIMRDGEEVVASLYHAAQRYEPWRPYLEIDRGIDRWNRALAESLSWRFHPQHLLVRYETLVVEPQRTLTRILRFLDCPDERGICAGYARTAERLVRVDEPWKRGNFDALANRRKFHHLFDSEQRHRIVANLDGLDWNVLARLPQVLA